METSIVFFLINILLFILQVIYCSKNNELLSAVVVYRHGDRTPISFYPKDPYQNRSYWPVGPGQLTNNGKMHHFQLGEWLRQRYDGWLPSEYSEDDIHVQSTDVDRTLMSAAANLAGLYPPKNDQVWNQALLWQPIPIHTLPQNDDPVLAMDKPCPKYDQLEKELYASDEFRKIDEQNKDMYDYITENSGYKVANLKGIRHMYSVLLVESKSNFTLPEWTHKVFPERMKPLAEFRFRVPCYTPEMARLKTGLWFNEITNYFQNITSGIPLSKFRVYSAHDTTIANFLTAMGAFENHMPPYASALLFELRRKGDSNVVSIFYKMGTEQLVPLNVTLAGCDVTCRLDDFVELLGPISLNVDQWNVECGVSWLKTVQNSSVLWKNVGLAVLVLIFFVLTCYCLFRKKPRYEPNNDLSVYMQLPNEDELAK